MKRLMILVALICMPITAYAAPPVDGQMVKFQPDSLWEMSFHHPVPLENVIPLSDKHTFPSISPDGTKVLFFNLGQPGEPGTISEWNVNTKKVNEILYDQQASNYIIWQDDSSFLMRERSKPFLRNGMVRTYHLNHNSSPQLRIRTPISYQELVAYDSDDVIILENRENQTLQAISDISRDRYYSPIVSPDNRFVAFCGLQTGVSLFDIQSNQVVYVGAHGTYPSFSPDGRYLVYAQTLDDGHVLTAGNIVIVDLQLHHIRLVDNPNHEIRVRATVSRNAEKIVIETQEGKTAIGSLNYGK